jgi:hypothetical protein
MWRSPRRSRPKAALTCPNELLKGVVPVTQSHVPSTALPEAEETRPQELSPPPEEPQQGSPPKAAAGSPGWTAGRITGLVIGALLVLLSLVLLGGGGTALWADRTQRDAGYATTDVHHFSTSGSALATESTELGSAGVGWLYSPGLMDKVRIRVTPSSGPPLFVGIGPSTEVDRYLAGVDHTVITAFWGDKTEAVDGGPPPSAPGTQDFWVASATGSGPQTLVWDPADGSWTVVVMNADGQPGINVGADLGAKVPALPWIAVGFLALGAILMGGGALLIVGAIRGPRASQVSTA